MTTGTAWTRRTLLTGSAAALAVAASPRRVFAQDASGFRGALNSEEFGVRPGAVDPASRAFQAMLDAAAKRDAPLFLPPGRYEISDITLPETVRLSGVPGATQLVYTGLGRFMQAEGSKRITLSGLTIDGANRWLGDDQTALVTLRNCPEVDISGVELRGSPKFGLWVERSGGRIADNALSGAGESGLYAVESTGLQITGNHVFDCGNGGILVHRWSKGADNTIVTGNRVERIAAKSGGTGENGNGVNVFRADGVMVSNNHVSNCAFSAIRSNAGSNVQILGNQCLASGEMAIYSEFGFEGAIIAMNQIDGAANGIAVVNFNEGGRLGVVSGNIVRNLRPEGPYVQDGQYFGIGISAEAETTVTGNVIENAPLWGLQIGWGPYLRNVSVTGNIIRRAGVGCAVSVVEGAGSALIQSNQFFETKGAAIAGFRWAEKVTDDLVQGSGESFPHLSLLGNQAA
ncbi:putative secreted repeat protein (TIGR03808 family) [Rhizobium sp. SG_E_25_P2]|uniref:TIGR03808 family TAT-translocated repetitive protein n=1 Tax=Rhizobium sp. SG_E_25_P2 TaxID=2879942 RepID=UPI0024731EE9|nr:TIGR03808 family TAT-translocated repetitive protein [Rhizobium sp. SG_E_25_P2]MDH6267896.1 putative secreted repeat protein (TIGR03808 family) [Rhizobium sp. SG_E_25_P2]